MQGSKKFKIVSVSIKQNKILIFLCFLFQEKKYNGFQVYLSLFRSHYYSWGVILGFTFAVARIQMEPMSSLATVLFTPAQLINYGKTGPLCLTLDSIQLKQLCSNFQVNINLPMAKTIHDSKLKQN